METVGRPEVVNTGRQCKCGSSREKLEDSHHPKTGNLIVKTICRSCGEEKSSIYKIRR